MSESTRILIVDDDPAMAGTIRDILQARGHIAEAVNSGEEALTRVRERPYDCVLSDIKMPGTDGVDLFRAIKGVRPEMLVVLMTAYTADGRVQEAVDEGVVAVLPKPLDLEQLLDFLTVLAEDRRVTIVDDDADFSRTMGDALTAHGHAPQLVGDPGAVMGALQGDPPPQTVLLDMKLNGVSGLEVLREMREKYPHLPVILVTGHAEEMGPAIEEALQMRAHACLLKPVDIEALLAMLDEVRLQDLGRRLGRPPRQAG